jgi:hypothetical protein
MKTLYEGPNALPYRIADAVGMTYSNGRQKKNKRE